MLNAEKVFHPNAKWVCASNVIVSPLIKKSFVVDKHINTAKITIAACGFFDLYINGHRAEADYYKPGWSNYAPIKSHIIDIEVSNYRIYYLTYNVSKFLNAGENSFSIMLGNGWYRQDTNLCQKIKPYGDTLKVIADLNIAYKDGSIQNVVTDSCCTWQTSHIIASSVYYGECQDLSLLPSGINASIINNDGWLPVAIADNPSATLSLQQFSCDRVIKQIIPQFVCNSDGVKIYDAGENISGFAQLTSAGGNLVVRYAELLNAQCTALDISSTLASDDFTIPEDSYLNTKLGDELSPHFSWHGFRYFSVQGNTHDVKCCVVHGDIDITSSFVSDNKVLNWYYNAFLRTQLNNMHCGVPSDCPHRERMGYTGDGHLTCDATMLMTDSKSFYRKWIQDILDSQDKNTGFVPYTAPFYGGGGGVGGWGSAIVITSLSYYQHYGDKEFLEQCYPAIIKWVKCMQSLCENGLLVNTQYKGWNLGEWCTPDISVLPIDFINTYFYIKCLMYTGQIAKQLGKPCEIDLTKCMEISKTALLNKFYDEQTDSFCNSVQGADLFAADLDLASSALIKKMAKRYLDNPTFDTGIFGTELLAKFLSENGCHDILFNLFSQNKFPSFGYMMDKDATSIWETWNGLNDIILVNSQNHPMLGASSKYLFYTILGIKMIEPAFNKIQVSPVSIKGLNYYKGQITTASGKIMVEYKHDEAKNKTSVTLTTDSTIDATLNFLGRKLALPLGGSATINC